MGVPSEPNSGEMAPTELALNDVTTGVEGVADSDGVVTAASVILGAFVLGGEIAAIVPLVFPFVPHFLEPQQQGSDTVSVSVWELKSGKNQQQRKKMEKEREKVLGCEEEKGVSILQFFQKQKWGSGVPYFPSLPG